MARQTMGTTPWNLLLLVCAALAALPACRRPPADVPPASPTPLPTTTQATTAPAPLDRTLRVLLLRDVAECVVRADQPFDVLDGDSGRVLATFDHPAPLSIAFADGVTRFTQLQRTFAARAVDLAPRGGGAVAVRVGETTRRYRGQLRLVRSGATAGSVINLVDMEEYLAGVVAAEMPKDFLPAALRAQAIAARTFGWYIRQVYGPGRDWDVEDDESSQVYLGLDSEQRAPEAVKAVRETRGIVCTWDAPDGPRIFPAYFSSTCGGATCFAPPKKGESLIPVLAGDVVCQACVHSPRFRWEPVVLAKRTLTTRLSDKYPRIKAIGPIAKVEITRRTALGRPTWIEVSDAQGRAVGLDIESFRLAVDPRGRQLLSGHFSVINEKDVVRFVDGRGFGHGEGLCQFGADGLARAGKPAADILRFYYPGSGLAKAY